jgi:hypothetical protein
MNEFINLFNSNSLSARSAVLSALLKTTEASFAAFFLHPYADLRAWSVLKERRKALIIMNEFINLFNSNSPTEVSSTVKFVQLFFQRF